MRFYQAQDGWLFLGARPGEAGLVGEAMGVDGAADLDAGALEQALAERFGEGTVAHWEKQLRAAGVSAQAVVALPDLMADPWVREHGLSVTQCSEEVGDVTYPGPSVRMTGTPVRVGQPVRQPGADAASVLTEVGLEDAIETLERQWVLQATGLPRGW
jgi:crotonobetainyl-CoA:carnitine CoA-transferase CaiB-like acyl-CoA transferase